MLKNMFNSFVCCYLSGLGARRSVLKIGLGYQRHSLHIHHVNGDDDDNDNEEREKFIKTNKQTQHNMVK